MTVRPLPVVTPRGCEGLKRRQQLLLHPLLGQRRRHLGDQWTRLSLMGEREKDSVLR